MSNSYFVVMVMADNFVVAVKQRPIGVNTLRSVTAGGGKALLRGIGSGGRSMVEATLMRDTRSVILKLACRNANNLIMFYAMWKIIRHDKPTVLIIGYRKFSRLMSVVYPEFAQKANFNLTDYVFEKDGVIDDLIESKDADVVVSAGSNATYLESMLSVPVLGLEVSEGDLLEALSKAGSIENKILLITYHKEYRVLDFMRPVFSAEITHKTYSTPDEARETLYLAATQDTGVVVGSSYLCELAERQNLKSILIYSKDSCRKVIEAAIEKGLAELEQNLNHAVNEIVLEGSGMPALLVDFSGDLLRYNEIAIKRLDLHGEPDALRLVQLIESGATEGGVREKISIELDGVVRTFTRHLLTIKGKKRGYLFSIKIDRDSGRVALPEATEFDNRMVYASNKMANVHRIIKTYSATEGTVLITGETGTGKELIAREIHRSGPFSKGEFVAINCGAIPEELFESEIFGYVDGAFTASRRGGRTGLLEAANDGVFFLDEISELPLSQQAKLLRVMQERKIRRLGTNKETPLQVKFVCASNQNLADCVKAGKFREDLFYRIHIFAIDLPSLRERPEDIPAIGKYVAEKINRQYGLNLDIEELFALLGGRFSNYYWPGNVRQLENIVERLMVSFSNFPEHSQFLEALPSILPEWFEHDLKVPTAGNVEVGAIKEQELSLILEVMDRFNGDKVKAANYLGISQTTLWRRLKKLS